VVTVAADEIGVFRLADAVRLATKRVLP